MARGHMVKGHVARIQLGAPLRVKAEELGDEEDTYHGGFCDCSRRHCSPPTFTSGYVVNCDAASPAEMQLLCLYGPSHRVFNRMGLAGRSESQRPRHGGRTANKCWYVLAVLLCD